MLAVRNRIPFYSTAGTSFRRTVGGGSEISKTFVDPHGVNGRFDIWRIRNSDYRHRGNTKLTASYSQYFRSIIVYRKKTTNIVIGDYVFWVSVPDFAMVTWSSSLFLMSGMMRKTHPVFTWTGSLGTFHCLSRILRHPG